MPRQNTDSAIRARVDDFVNELSDLIRQAALEAVEESLMGRARPARSSSAGTATRASAGGRKKRGRRGGRSKAGADPQKILSFVAKSPEGARVEEMARELGLSSESIKPTVAALLAAKQVRREGKARGTRYFVGGGGASSGVGRKKGRRKKKAARRKTRSSRKKTAS